MKLTFKVLKDLERRKQSNGEGTAPLYRWTFFNFSKMTSLLVARDPTMMSQWPPKYLVQECITMSMPKPKGFWNETKNIFFSDNCTCVTPAMHDVDWMFNPSQCTHPNMSPIIWDYVLDFLIIGFDFKDSFGIAFSSSLPY